MRLCVAVGVCNAMACYHPMNAVRMRDGSVKFVSKWKNGAGDGIVLPCGQCVGCRLEKSRQWAMRCVHEASLYDHNAFITLTYNDENVPRDGSLNYEHFQRFMKRLRSRTGVPVRFYMCGEYGEETFRPHFHACLFGYDFPDKVLLKKTSDGNTLYNSALLESLWPYGMSSTAAVTFDSAAYVARYCMAKITGQAAEYHYRRVMPDGETVDLTPEFNRMSLKPGIGAGWLEKFREDVYPRDYVIVNGVKVRPPDYYDKLYKRQNPGEYSELTANREFRSYVGITLKGEGTDARLAVKETVKLASIFNFKRGVE